MVRGGEGSLSDPARHSIFSWGGGGGGGGGGNRAAGMEGIHIKDSSVSIQLFHVTLLDC